MMGIDMHDWDSMIEDEQKAWKMLKQTIDAIPAEGLYTFFHGDASERDQLMDDLGLCRENWWYLGVLKIEEQ